MQIVLVRADNIRKSINESLSFGLEPDVQALATELIGTQDIMLRNVFTAVNESEVPCEIMTETQLVHELSSRTRRTGRIFVHVVDQASFDRIQEAVLALVNYVFLVEDANLEVQVRVIDGKESEVVYEKLADQCGQADSTSTVHV